MTVGQIIHKRRKERHLTLEELGAAIGVSKQTVQRYETGVISNIPGENIEAMAKVLLATPAALMGWEPMQPLGETGLSFGTVDMPVLGKIACGEPIFAEGNYDGDLTFRDFLPDSDFCLIAKGDSMVGARIFDGDIVFIRAQESVDNGQIAAVLVDDEATLKRVYYFPEEKKLILTPENNKYAPMVYVGKQIKQVRILGLAVAFQSPVN